MKSSFLLLLSIIYFSNIAFSQDGQLRITPYVKGSVINVKGDTLNGYIRMASSAFKLRFKDSLKQKRSKKVDFKNISKIITVVDTLNPREFCYKKTNINRFLHFVELVYNDSIRIFIKSSDNLDLFYSQFDRRTTRELMDSISLKDEMDLVRTNNNYSILNSRMVRFKNISAYVDIKIKKISYLLQNNIQDELIVVHENLFGKKLRKAGAEYFKDCLSLSNRIRNNEYKVGDLPIIIQEFKDNCE